MSETNRLAIVVFTGGPLTPVNRVFFERLATDTALDLRGVIVDEYAKPRRPLLKRLAAQFREDGAEWIWYRVSTALESLKERIAGRLFDLMHKNRRPARSYEELQAELGIPVYRVADIHDAGSLHLIEELGPQLGVIIGGRILRDSVTSIPAFGTLNIHKRKVPEYRGGGPVGYWEILSGENSIGVTIHYARNKVDTGEVLAETTIPIEDCDNLESLKIKADIVGARLYHETISEFARGRRQAIPQDLAKGRTYRAPSASKVWRLQRKLRTAALHTLPSLQAVPSAVVRLRLIVQYLLVLPLLLSHRRRLMRERRAPICIFFYHVIANRLTNHMCLPLEEFVRQLEFVNRYYDVVSLDEAVSRLRSGQNDSISVSITFDDGYRDNKWAIEYLRYFRIPATFFVSIGHVLDGSSFEHDRDKGFYSANPMRVNDLRELCGGGFNIESHGVYHEDFGRLDLPSAEHVLQESRRLIEETLGRRPEHFSFPKGQRGKNITASTFDLATRHYSYVHSAYGGYNIPAVGRRHFLRIGNTVTVTDLAMIMDGYVGLRECLGGNAWGLKTNAHPPY